jgi:hypothetical protein
MEAAANDAESQLIRTSPAAFDSLAPVTKLALGAYEALNRKRHKRRRNAYPVTKPKLKR